jgi:hypothetical protein
MSKERLKTLRILIPGIVVFLFTIPLFNPILNLPEYIETISVLETGVYLAVTFFIGALYYILNIRGYFLKSSLNKIHENIKDRLLEPFENIPSIYRHKKN